MGHAILAQMGQFYVALYTLTAAIARNTHNLMGARQRPDDYRYEGSLP